MDDYISKPIRLDELTAALEGTASRGAVGDSPVPDMLDYVALATLLELVGSDPDFVDQLVDEYLADAPRQVAAVRAAFDAGDPAGLVQPAHKLKGTSLNLGGMRVAEVARSIEEHGRTGTLDGVQVLLADLDAARADLADELERGRARRWIGA
jgi:HPt (histidine-containing phosphotransfer) domain-containing protein